MEFKFKNMLQYVRNAIEPHIRAERQVAHSEYIELTERLTREVQRLQTELQVTKTELKQEMQQLPTIAVGWILAWPTGQTPDKIEKWKLCNGDWFDKNRYPKLYSVLQDEYVPDYRGFFLRGQGGNSAELGVAQGDAIRNITGNFVAMGWGGHPSQPFGPGDTNGAFSYVKRGQDSLPPDRANDNTEMVDKISFSAALVVPTAVENRPVNKAVHFFIRALD